MSLAQRLLEQDEVKEFIPHVVGPDQLFFTVILAVYLSSFCSYRSIEHRRALMGNINDDPGEAFLELWEEHVYPILKATENESWAEMWRGGHITNEAV